MKNFLSLCLFCINAVIFSSCGQQESNKTNQSSGLNETQSNTPTSTVQPGNKNSTPNTNVQSQKPGEMPPSGSGPVRVNFAAGEDQAVLNGSISGFGDNKIYEFEVKKGQKLSASIKPKAPSGNIRISQIVSPSGKADGPFSTQMDYDLNEAGNWKLIVGEDQMAGDSWKGEYILRIVIK